MAQSLRVAAVAVFISAGASAGLAASFPPDPGFDQFPTTATVTIYADPACTLPLFPIAMQGPTKIKRSAPIGPPPNVIDTEIVAMTLTSAGGELLVEAPGGSNPNDALAPPCNAPGPSADGGPGCSPGQIQAQGVTSDFPADSFFDVFFEVTVPGIGLRLFNKAPIRMEAVITRIPPEGTIYVDPADPCLPLFNTCDPFGPPVLFLGHASHNVEPKNHYKCYKAKDLKQPKFLGTVVSLADQFGPQPQVEVKKPFLLCNPASKNGERIEDPEAHLCCYKVKGPKFVTPKTVEITDQFGTLKLGNIKKPQLLCQPCSKIEL